MKRNFVMVFKNKDALNSMIELRKRGWTYQSLGLVFNVDHSSIYMACKIRGIAVPKHPVSLNVFDILSKLVESKPEPKEKMYADYIEEQRRRRFPKLYSHLMGVK